MVGRSDTTSWQYAGCLQICRAAMRRTRTSEAVVQPGAHHCRVNADAVVAPGDEVVLGAEVVVKSFDARRPVAGQRGFRAHAEHPAEVPAIIAGDRVLVAEIAKTEAARAVDEELVEGEAGPGPNRAERVDGG